MNSLSRAVCILVLFLSCVVFAAAQVTPVVWVFDNNDADYLNPPFEDTVTCISTDGNELWSVPMFNITQTWGGNRLLAAHQENAGCWIADMIGSRLVKLDSSGGFSAEIDLSEFGSSGVGAVSVSDDGQSIYAPKGGSTNTTGINVYDPSGNLIGSTADAGAFDLAYSSYDDTVVCVNKNLYKVTADLSSVIWSDTTMIVWNSVSVAVNAMDGAIWIAERRHPQVPGSADRIRILDPDGNLTRTIPLSWAPWCVAVKQSDGTCYVGTDNAVYQYNADGTLVRTISQGAWSIALDNYQNIWLADRNSDRIYKYAPDGSLLWTSDAIFSTDQKWIVFGYIGPSTTNIFPTADPGGNRIVVDTDSDGSELVTLDGSGSSDSDGTITGYSWVEDGIEIASGETAAVTLDSGQHYITLTVTDDGGASDSETVVIIVNASPASAALRCDSRLTPVYDLSSSTPVLSWEFSDTDPGDYQTAYELVVCSSPGETTDIVWNPPKDYSTSTSLFYAGPPLSLNVNYFLYVKVWDRYDSDGGFSVGEFAINTAPVADAGVNQTVSDADRDGSALVSLDGSGCSDSDGTIDSFVWRDGGVQIATGVNPGVTLSNGLHGITLTITDNNGATDSDVVLVIVASPPSVSGLSCDGKPTPCSNVSAYTPDLAWVFDDLDPLDSQAAWQLVVCSSPGVTTDVVWDSLKKSGSSSLIAYSGPPLDSNITYHWYVKVWDGYGFDSGFVGGQFAILDIGLRAFDGTSVVKIAVDYVTGATHPLRIHKDGVTYGVILVPPTIEDEDGEPLPNPEASVIRIFVNGVVMALKKMQE